MRKSTENKGSYEEILPKSLYLNQMKPLYLSIKKNKTGHRGTSHRCNHQNLVHEKCYGTDDPVSTNQFTTLRENPQLQPHLPETCQFLTPQVLVLGHLDHTLSLVTGKAGWDTTQQLTAGSESTSPSWNPSFTPSVNSAVKQKLSRAAQRHVK